MSPLARTIEALLFLSSDPVTHEDLIRATQCDDDALEAAMAELQAEYAPGRHGMELRQLSGGFTFGTTPESEPAARRLLSNPRMSALTPPQAETLAIIGYLQPVSRPEITRIRGVNADSTTAMLLERGLIEITGRSDFGAVLYSTTALFLKLFGLNSIEDLPDPSEWDPTPEEEADLRDRLLKAGEARAPDTLTGETPELSTDTQTDVPQPTAS
jgi:segregation and condensation protein B